MKIYKFFITKIFLRKVLISITMIILLFMANYTTFIAARSILSTFQGYYEMSRINQRGNYIANLNPDSNVDIDSIKENGTQKVYDYLNKNFKYAFYTDGFIVSLPHFKNMEISLSYMNREYYGLNKFKISQGKGLDFNYQFGKSKELPVLVGKGLSKEYPIGSTIKIKDPVIERPLTLRVRGILKQNACHSNYYALNSKNYYNFSIFVPVNKEFIKNANIDLKLNGLMDIIIIKTTKQKIKELSKVMNDNLNLKFDFFSQQENFDYFNEYYLYSLKIIAITTLVLIIVITCLSIWNALVSVRLMIKDFTINLLVGLSYSKLKGIFYKYFRLMFFVNLIVIFIITAYNRYGCWLRKDSTFATYGLFGLIGMDWCSLLIVFISDIIIGKIIVGNMLRKIKKIPISLGVLQ